MLFGGQNTPITRITDPSDPKGYKETCDVAKRKAAIPDANESLNVTVNWNNNAANATMKQRITMSDEKMTKSTLMNSSKKH